MTIKPGALRFNTDSMKLEIFRGSANYEGSASMAGIGTLAAGQWEEIVATSPEAQTGGARGVYMGGRTPTNLDEIDYINIATTGNSVDFGDLATASRGFASGQTSSRVRGLAIGGSPTSQTVAAITIASTGSATEHSSILNTGTRLSAGASSSTRALTAGGIGGSPATQLNVIEAVDIASLGSAIDFGDCTISAYYRTGLASPTRAVIAGGYAPAVHNVIEYVTFSTQGNAADFGDLTVASFRSGSGGNSTRGLFVAGGTGISPFPETNAIDYITIATLGNAQDFGDATQGVKYAGGVSSPTRHAIMGGFLPSAQTNTIEYMTISTTGDAIDFGDLTNTARSRGTGVSNGHGGL